MHIALFFMKIDLNFILFSKQIKDPFLYPFLVFSKIFFLGNMRKCVLCNLFMIFFLFTIGILCIIISRSKEMECIVINNEVTNHSCAIDDGSICETPQYFKMIIEVDCSNEIFPVYSTTRSYCECCVYKKYKNCVTYWGEFRSFFPFTIAKYSFITINPQLLLVEYNLNTTHIFFKSNGFVYDKDSGNGIGLGICYIFFSIPFFVFIFHIYKGQIPIAHIEEELIVLR